MVNKRIYNAENEMMLSVCHYINSFPPEGATNMSTLYLNYFLLIVYIETVHSFLHLLLKFYTEQKFVWFCYLVVFISIQHFTFLQKKLPVLRGFYRAMHFSAKRGIAIACRLSVRPSVRLSVCDVGSHRLEFFENNFTFS